MRKKILILNEEIYKLREQGFTYQKITQYFNNKGIKVKIGIIRKRCKKIYQEKGKREPDLKVGRKKVIQMQDEEIYQLRQDGLSYRKITQYFNNKGIKVSSETIRNRCKNIYQKKIEEKPDLKVGRKKVIQIPDEEIYKLREQGLSYEKIVQYFYKKGMKVSFATIRIRCKRMYQEKASDYKNKKSDKTSLADLEKKLQELKEKKEKSGELLEEYVELKEKYEQLRKQQGKKEEEK